MNDVNGGIIDYGASISIPKSTICKTFEELEPFLKKLFLAYHNAVRTKDELAVHIFKGE